MAIVVECPRCRRVTPFADNDAGLAIACLGCGQVTRVPGGREKKAVLAYEPTPGRARGSRAWPYVIGATVVLAFGIMGAMGFLRYRSMAATRQARQALARIAATIPVIPTPAFTAPTTAVVEKTVVQAPTTKPVVRPSERGVPRVVGFVGLERLELNGRYSVDSYDSSAGPYRESAAGAKAPLVSNLKVRLYGEGRVQSVVRIAEGGDVKRVDAVKLELPATREPRREGKVVPPPVDASSAKRENDNEQLPEKYFRGRDFVLHAGKTVALAGGVYALEDLVIEQKATLVLDGPATFVLSGRLIVHGNVETHRTRPTSLRILVAGGEQPVAINNSSDLHLDLYAPGNTVEIYGKGDVFGSVVGKVLRVNGERGLHFDESIPPTLEAPAASSK